MKRIYSIILGIIFIFSFFTLCFFFAHMIMISRDITGYNAEEIQIVRNAVDNMGCL